jgi:hypothetical protein
MSTLSMRIVTYLIEYLDEYAFILKTILDYESGTRWVLLMQKKQLWKISCLGTFKRQPWILELRGKVNA